MKVGDDVLELRNRPADLTWPEPAERRRGLRAVGIGLPMMALFLVWRLARMNPTAGIAVAALLGVATLVAAVVYVRRGRLWSRADPAFAVMAARALAARPSPASRDGPWAVWPGRVRRRGAVEVCTDTDASCPPVGIVGPDAKATALWIAVQLALRRGGAVVEPGHMTVGDPRGAVEIHLVRGRAGCEACADPSAGGDVVHLGYAERASDLPAWCVRVVAAGSAPSETWLDQVADRRCATGIPENVDALGLPDSDDGRPLAVPIGVDPEGPITIDLVDDGPHALVAGTTGSGKSEALLTWLLGVCARNGPERLRLVLIDHKGGATFNRIAGLPHVLGVTTDLDPAGTARVLEGLERLIIRREAELAEAGFSDIAVWEQAYRDARPGTIAPPPPRFVIAVDEFKVLVQGNAAALDSFVRTTAQGRSLGIHLIAATQRPGGAVSAAMRANIDLVVCLRTSDARESQEVRGDDRAARLPRIPGRALIGTREFQWARVDNPHAEAARLAAKWGPAPPSAPLWAPPLPDSAPAGAFGTCEIPGDPAHQPLIWDGPTLLVTAPATAGDAALQMALAAAEDAARKGGLPVHVLSSAPPRGGTWSSWSPTTDAQACARIVDGIGAESGHILVVDRLDDLMATLGNAAGTALAERAWRELVRGALDRRCRLVVAAGSRSRPPAGFDQCLHAVHSADDRIPHGLPASTPISPVPGRVIAKGFHPTPVPAQVHVGTGTSPPRPTAPSGQDPPGCIGHATLLESRPVTVSADQTRWTVLAKDPLGTVDAINAARADIGEAPLPLDAEDGILTLRPHEWSRLLQLEDDRSTILIAPRPEVLQWVRSATDHPFLHPHCEQRKHNSGLLVRDGRSSPFSLVSVNFAD